MSEQCSVATTERGQCIFPAGHGGDHRFPDGKRDLSDEIRIRVLLDRCEELQQLMSKAEARGAALAIEQIATLLEKEDPKAAGLGGESGEAFARAVLKDFATRLRAGEIQ